MNRGNRWMRRALASLSLALASGAWMQAAAESVDARVQPLDAPTEFMYTKSMAAGLAVEPVSIDLGEWGGQKAAPIDGNPIIGVSRHSAQTETPDALAALLLWQPSAAGGWVAAVSVRSGGADGLRLGVLVDQLPGSAMLRLYADDRRDAVFEIAGQRVLQIVQANIDAGDNSADGRIWWAPSSSGEQVTLEIELPPGTPASSLRVALPRVMHIYENLSLPMAGEGLTIGQSMYCQQDANCQGNAYDTLRRAVARTSYVSGQYIQLCSGALLNDKASSGTPYFLTANHCLSSQTVASSLETTWFYWSSSCGSASLSSDSRILRTGATLLYSSRDPDVTLLRLNDMPPGGAVFAGWDSSYRAVGDAVVGIHHPRGDMQKISLGSVSSRANCTQTDAGFSCRTPVDGSYYYADWSQGLTEPGSSGSPLFFNGRVTGSLSGGPAALSCTAGSVRISVCEAVESVTQS